MPSGKNVRPEMWDKSSILDLFDDGSYSAIWGVREGDDSYSLGVRWNGTDDYIGYPNQGKYAVWYSEPRFLEYGVLTSLLSKIKTMERDDNTDLHIKNILFALSDCGG